MFSPSGLTLISHQTSTTPGPRYLEQKCRFPAESVPCCVQSGLYSPNPCWTKSEYRLQFNRCVCGVILLVETLDIRF
jgi:hypothetical protein